MSEGEKVYRNIKAIIDYCNNVNNKELDSLLDPKYSKEKFDLKYPFFIETQNNDDTDKKISSERYIAEIYTVNNKKVRVTNDWYKRNIPYFNNYLSEKKIIADINGIIDTPPPLTRKRGRYKGNPIGNSQNSLIRNILSNLGNESFNEDDWEKTKEYFNNKCVYCGANGQLEMDHAIPINREKLGEHKIGNLVPACSDCNTKKADKDYREFLGNNSVTIKVIEEYMKSKNYVPLEGNDQIKKILDIAYKEISLIADRYITIINELCLIRET